MADALIIIHHGEFRNEENITSSVLAVRNLAHHNNHYVSYRKARMVMIKIPPQAAPMGRNHRVSSDSAWPLRGPDGKTLAERRAEREKEQSK
jgi:hypothetical protein